MFSPIFVFYYKDYNKSNQQTQKNRKQNEEEQRKTTQNNSDNINIDYGGKEGYAKRVNIDFSTKEYDFSINLRSKSSSDNYPGYANGDYKKT